MAVALIAAVTAAWTASPPEPPVSVVTLLERTNASAVACTWLVTMTPPRAVDCAATTLSSADAIVASSTASTVTSPAAESAVPCTNASACARTSLRATRA